MTSLSVHMDHWESQRNGALVVHSWSTVTSTVHLQTAVGPFTDTTPVNPGYLAAQNGSAYARERACKVSASAPSCVRLQKADDERKNTPALNNNPTAPRLHHQQVSWCSNNEDRPLESQRTHVPSFSLCAPVEEVVDERKNTPALNNNLKVPRSGHLQVDS